MADNVLPNVEGYLIKYKNKTVAGIYNQINDDKVSPQTTYSSALIQGLIDTETENRIIAISEILDALNAVKGKQNPIGLLTISEDEVTSEELDEFVQFKKGRTPQTGDTVAVYKNDQFLNTQIYNGSEWTLWSKSNLLTEASVTTQGIAQFATETEVKEGTSTDRAVTPADVQTALDEIEEYFDEL